MDRQQAKGTHMERWLEKARKYCATQERAAREVLQKLRSWGVPPAQWGAITGRLKHEGFLDESRYARAYASSKLNQNRWGKIKIRAALRSAGLEEEHITAALNELDEENYKHTLSGLLEKKMTELSVRRDARAKQKAAAFCIGKGFEADLVWDALKKMQ